MALYSYLKDVQRFLSDTTQRNVNPADMVEWINRARRVIAEQAQCIRVLAPTSGAVTTITVSNGGTGYTNPVVTISPPDYPSGSGSSPLGSQATATATVIGGVIIDIQVVFGGSGYFQPQVTITDPTGTGAIAIPAISPISATQDGKEVYKFSDVPLGNFPGVEAILAVRSIAFIYANYRYTLGVYSWTTYQSKIRQYPFQYYYVPAFAAQFGQGVNGSLYFYPIPSTIYQFELDAICIPSDLETDQDVEAIPSPWTDAVVFLATHYGYLSLQNLNYAEYYKNQWIDMMHRFSSSARVGRAPNPNGNGRW